jgi:hypothetical protein
MNVVLIFAWVWAAFVALSFWESSTEGRNCWDKGKCGWKIKLGKYILTTRYHFFLFCVMIPLLLFLPLVIFGWDAKLFGVLVSAYFSGLVIEDFFWFVVNPVVKFSEFTTSFTDYYPWIRIGGRKIIPTYYVLNIVIAILSWLLIWR